MSHRSLFCGLAALALMAAAPASAEREPVLKQIKLPHNYYYREMYLPQLTGGPSALAWSPDGRRLVFSMRGSLWVQDVESTRARQLTAGPGYDYQPDWSVPQRTPITSWPGSSACANTRRPAKTTTRHRRNKPCWRTSTRRARRSSDGVER